MPSISRFRIVNFRFDNDKKYISNELFTFNGQNALLNLENGGGKSVILQLALQVLLPNSDLASRKFVDYFKVNSGTVHIMIEWILDSITREYLLTGICASRDSEGLRFFTYIHEYGVPNECDIANIPVVNSKKQVTGYSEYYRFLRNKASEIRLNTYSKDRVRDYREKLYTYNLFDSEFNAVKIINQSEGGIEKFFERARKSRDVIEKLIIPAIPSLGGDSENLLADTFRKHLNNLKSIPLLQHNIKVYDQFCERAKELIQKIENYGGIVHEHTTARQQILTLENLVRIVLSRLDSEINKNNDGMDEMKQQIRQQKFKRASWMLGKISMQKDHLGNQKDALEFSLDTERIQLEASEKKNEYWTAINYCMDLKENRKKLLELKAGLETLNLEKGEIELQYQNELLHLHKLLSEEYERLDFAVTNLQRELDDRVGENANNKKALKELGSRKQALLSDIAVVNNNIERLEKQLNECSSLLSWDLTLFLDPVKSLEKLNSQFVEIQKKEQEYTDASNEAIRKLEDSKMNLLFLEGNEKVLQEKETVLANELNAYDSRLQALIEEIGMYGIAGDPYYGNVEEKLCDVAAKSSSALTSVLNRMYKLEGKKLLLDGLDYYIPDNEIKQVDIRMKESGIHCMPGALWLKNQEKSRRAVLLRMNPLLPYSIVVENTEMKKVWELAPELLKQVEQFPVAIISSSEEGIRYTDMFGVKADMTGVTPDSVREKIYSASADVIGADQIGGQQVYILNAANNRLVLDENELAAYMENLGTNLAHAVDEADALKKDQQAIYNLIARFNEFVKFNDAGYRSEMLVNITKLEKELEICKAEQLKCINIRKTAEKQIDDTRDLLGKLSDEGKLLKDNIHLMEIYIKASCEMTEYKRRLNELKISSEKLSEEITRLEQLGEAIEKEVQRVENRKSETERERSNVEKRLSKAATSLAINEFTVQVYGGLEETEAKVAALESKIGHTDIDAVKLSILTLEKACQSNTAEVRKRGFEEKDFEGVFERIPEIKIAEDNVHIKQMRKEIKESEAAYNKLIGEIGEFIGKMGEMKARIEQEYEENPFCFNDMQAFNEIYFNDLIKELGSKLKKLSVKADEMLKQKERINSNLNNISSFITYRGINLPQELRGEMLELKGSGESITLWDMMKMDPEVIAVIINKYKTIYDTRTEELNQGKEAVKGNFDKLYSDAEWDDNTTVRQVLSNLMDDNLYNIDYVKTLFNNLFISIENLKQAMVLQLEECRRNKDELVERCYIKAEAVYNEVKMVDTFSRIKIKDDNVKTVKIDMPKLDEERGKAIMSLYLENCIDEIEKMKAAGTYDPVKIDDSVLAMMSPVKLLDAVVSLNDFNIKVFKPEHSMELSGYIPWEVVIQWSGGEKLAGFFAMFISIISYLRYKRTGWQGSPKVIWIDNPFGQANAGHLLDYIFELAKATKTQMICLTGLQEVNIYAQFDVVYSLVHRMLTNMSVIQSRAVKMAAGLESAYYVVNQEQMTMFSMLGNGEEHLSSST